MSNTEYSGLSKFLHRLALKSKAIAETSFDIECSTAKGDTSDFSDKHVFVSGLARSGTTVLMTYLYETGVYRSLTYLDMPFVLMPNLWKKFSGSKKASESEYKERAHKDGILVGFDSPEAFEEVFWRIFCGPDFIFDDKLKLHEVNDEVIENFKKYVRNILLSRDAPDKKRYLSKNNNNVLRLKSIHQAFPQAHIIIPFRDPLQHALSLMKQHEHFSEVQEGDKFTLEYMTWLGHHEFGLNQKTFFLNDEETFNKTESYKKTDINFWLADWKNYYKYVNSNHPANSLFLSNEIFSANPAGVLAKLFAILEIELPVVKEEPFVPRPKTISGYDETLLNECNAIYKELEAKFNGWYL